MNRRIFARAALALPFLTGALVSRSVAQEVATLKVGVLSSMTVVPFYIADRLGYFAEQGLKIEIVEFGSAVQMIAPLGAGQLDVGGGGVSAGIYNAVGRGIDVKMVADLGSDPPGYGFQNMLVRTDLVRSGRYKSPKDLRGMAIGMGAAPGAPVNPMLYHLLRSVGMTMAQVKLVYLSNPDMVVAFKNGSVDAALLPEPNATVAVRDGYALKMYGADKFYPNQQIAAVMFGSSLLKSHRDIGNKFMLAYLKAARYYNGALAGGRLAGPNASAVIKILVDSTPIKDPDIYRAVVPNGNNPNGQLNLKSLKDDLAFFRDAGLVAGNVSVDDAIDTSFVAFALKRSAITNPSLNGERSENSMFYTTRENNHGLPFNPFKALVVPRPIGWISTIGHDGIVNLAPFSMFNQLGYDPPIVFFSGSNRPGTGDRKDSVTNAEQSGEFVVNMATYALRDRVSKTATFVPPDVDEFEYAGLTKAPSRLVAPPRVAESPMSLECRFHSTMTLPANRRSTAHHVVIGEVVGIYIGDEYITEDGRFDYIKARPLARLGYNDYTSVTDVFAIAPAGDASGQIGEAVAQRTADAAR